jgi:hypothetical protein
MRLALCPTSVQNLKVLLSKIMMISRPLRSSSHLPAGRQGGHGEDIFGLISSEGKSGQDLAFKNIIMAV